MAFPILALWSVGVNATTNSTCTQTNYTTINNLMSQVLDSKAKLGNAILSIAYQSAEIISHPIQTIANLWTALKTFENGVLVIILTITLLLFFATIIKAGQVNKRLEHQNDMLWDYVDVLQDQYDLLADKHERRIAEISGLEDDIEEMRCQEDERRRAQADDSGLLTEQSRM
jgi:hypothetical protein